MAHEEMCAGHRCRRRVHDVSGNDSALKTQVFDQRTFRQLETHLVQKSHNTHMHTATGKQLTADFCGSITSQITSQSDHCQVNAA